MKITPKTTLKYFKYWPPFLASGISVKEFDLDKRYVVSQMKLSWWNSNAYRTMYGGSLFSMCDPFFVFILAHNLGSGYYIWDLESNIKFIKATKKNVYARFEITESELKKIKEAADSGERVTPVFNTTIVDSDDNLVAEVKKVLYVKAKPKKNNNEL